MGTKHQISWFQIAIVSISLILANCANKETAAPVDDAYLSEAGPDAATVELNGDVAAASIEEEAEAEAAAASAEFDEPDADGFTSLTRDTAAEEAAEEVIAETESSDSVDAGLDNLASTDDALDSVKEEEVTSELSEGLSSTEQSSDTFVSTEPAPVTEVSSTPEATVSPETLSEPVADTAAVAAAPVVVVSKAPSIPEQAFEKNGELLNRFYFVRSGDTAESLAKMFYGDEARSTDLKEWNKRFNEGNVVYYVSPENPGDSSMKSFYDERFIDPEEYVVQKGDVLSEIAKARYGHTSSWREIAKANAMEKPDFIKSGQTISLYPSDLASFAYRKDEVLSNQDIQASNQAIHSQTEHSAEPEEQMLLPSDGSTLSQPSLENKKPLELPKKEVVEKKTPKKAAGGISDFLSRNLIFVFIGLGVMAVAIFGYLVFGPKRQDTF